MASRLEPGAVMRWIFGGGTRCVSAPEVRVLVLWTSKRRELTRIMHGRCLDILCRNDVWVMLPGDPLPACLCEGGLVA